MDKCLFCSIASKEIPSAIVYEDDQVFAFRDIQPQAPVHILVIPKRHVDSAHALTHSHTESISHLLTVIPGIAEQEGIAKDGYRIVTNVGQHGQQTVSHLHYHILGGRQLSWPPG